MKDDYNCVYYELQRAEIIYHGQWCAIMSKPFMLTTHHPRGMTWLINVMNRINSSKK